LDVILQAVPAIVMALEEKWVGCSPTLQHTISNNWVLSQYNGYLTTSGRLT
jgi:hypothetical protein